MDRRYFLGGVGVSFLGLLGCRSKQVGTVMSDSQKDTVGSHAAGAETFKPLIDESLGKLLARQGGVQPASVPAACRKIAFVGLENKSSEELGDFKEQIVEIIDTRINQSKAFEQVSRRYVEAGLRECRLRPDELFIMGNQQKFLALMQSQGRPFDCLLFAKITSGTTTNNGSSQKDYLLTLELVDIATGTPDKESATIRKGYTRTHRG